MKTNGQNAEEAIRLEAYILSEKAGHPAGMESFFWVQAERIVHDRIAAEAAAAVSRKAVSKKPVKAAAAVSGKAVSPKKPAAKKPAGKETPKSKPAAPPVSAVETTPVVVKASKKAKPAPVEPPAAAPAPVPPPAAPAGSSARPKRKKA